MRRCPMCGNLTTDFNCLRCTGMPATVPVKMGRSLWKLKGFQSLIASSTLALLTGCNPGPNQRGAWDSANYYCRSHYQTSVESVQWDEKKYVYYFRCERKYQILEEGVEK